MNNTLLQRLDASADTTGSSVYASNRHLEEVFVAAEAVSAGDFLCLDLSKTSNPDKLLFVKKANNGAAATGLCCGVAIADAGAGENVRVLIRGIVSANVATGVAAGDRLALSSTGGRAEPLPDIDEAGAAVVPLVPIVAYAITAESSNASDVYVFPQF